MYAPAASCSIVVAGPIPPGRDPAVEERLERYRVLCRRLPAPPVPEPSALTPLRETAPHAGLVLDFVADQLALAHGVGAPAFVLPPLLLHGRPGSGKTWLARKLAEILSGPTMLLYPCAGLNNAIPIKCQRRGFHESGPGVVVDLLARQRSAGGIVVWDEIDKVGSSDWNGDPVLALLQLLEPETSRSLHDEFLQSTVDLSLVGHVATANRIDRLPAALLSRMHAIEVRTPGVAVLSKIFATLRAEMARRLRVPAERLPALTELEVERLRRGIDGDPDLRALRAAYEADLLRRIRALEQGRLGVQRNRAQQDKADMILR